VLAAAAESLPNPQVDQLFRQLISATRSNWGQTQILRWPQPCSLAVTSASYRRHGMRPLTEEVRCPFCVHYALCTMQYHMSQS
jgi:hypothetical protein